MASRPDRIKTQRKYLKLKKNRSWLSTLLFLCIAGLSIAVVLLFVSIFSMFVVTNSLEMEYDAKKQLAALYEAGTVSSDDPYAVFDTAGMTYFILDSDGNTLHAQGENTCASGEGAHQFSVGNAVISLSESALFDYSGEIVLYADTENPVIQPKGNGSLYLDAKKLLKQVFSPIAEAEGDGETEPETIAINRVLLPVWEAFPMKDGAETMYFQANVPISPTNVALVFTMMAVFTVLVFVVLIALILNAVSNGLNQRRVNKIFFTDMKVQGHNWTWFLVRAEQLLRAPGAAKKTFALVDLAFVEYRHFVICHSIDEGEAMLREIYRVLSGMTDKHELCAHRAEDSFSLLLRGDDPAALRTRIDGILSELGKIGSGHRLTYHAGIYPLGAGEGSGLLSRRKDVDVERDYNNACAATLSLGQNEGTCSAFYDEKLIEEQRWIDTVQSLQERAVANEEFVVYYQPKYHPRTHVLCGAEALIRWQSPEYGFLSPYRFIPIFEKNGFITEIDHYMLVHVARAQKKWLDEGQNCVPVSVNVSRAHFIESDLAEQIRDIVDAEGVPHNLIEIELTESAFFDDKKAMIDTIRKLKEYGFSVSMDDFGSGYSSLNSLKDMPLDILKLDAEFFRGTEAGTDRGEIVVSDAIRLAKHLNMRIVAEGVEARDQVEFLAKQGCDMIQGYYFAKPMPAADYEQRMQQGRNDGADAEPAAQ